MLFATTDEALKPRKELNLFVLKVARYQANSKPVETINKKIFNRWKNTLNSLRRAHRVIA